MKKMKKMKIMRLGTAVLCAVVWLLQPVTLQAQVHIGNVANPANHPVGGALLDLTSTDQLGLLPLSVAITDLDKIPEGFSERGGDGPAADLKGLVVYNTNTSLADGAGIYVWNGANWNKVKGCPLPTIASPAADTTLTSYGETTRRLAVTTNGGTLSYQWESSDTGAPDSWNPVGGAIDAAYNAPVTAAGTVYYHCIVSNECGNTTSPVFTVTVLASIPTNDSYTITGATCYDVAQSGTLTGRTNAFAATHTMTYTFKYGNAFTDLSFAVLSDPSGIIESISSPTATSGSGSSTQTFEVTFVSDVESIVYATRAMARIAACYVDNDNTIRIAYINVFVQDEICCAYAHGSDGMCYRRSENAGNNSSKPKCPSGWAVVPFTTLSEYVSSDTWYAYTKNTQCWASATSGDVATFNATTSGWSTGLQLFNSMTIPCRQ
ncbi:MAG: hypothetical protein LBO74_01940, partial [Candidatus Symbiothrix sp.]|jgi:hypothetical protein|nr:hypothetical protein [Candidatus Symbiothrix sp.]